MGLLKDAVEFIDHKGRTPPISNIDHLIEWSERRKHATIGETSKSNIKTFYFNDSARKKNYSNLSR